MQSRLERLRQLEAQRKQLLHVEKPALEGQWLRLLGVTHLETLALEVECKRWSGVLREMRDGLAHGAMPSVEEALATVDATMKTDRERVARWQREVAAATDPARTLATVSRRAASEDQPYSAARDGDTAPYVFNLATAITSLEQEIAELLTRPPFTYATLLDDPEWIAEQQAQFAMEATALKARRDAQQQLAQLLALGPLG
jgi:hypothetical protein